MATKLSMLLFLIVLVIGTSGCFGNAAMVQAMKDNNATFCGKVSTPWGGATYFQSNPVYGTASCDGMQVSYGNPNASSGIVVPVVITPNVAIGQPTFNVIK